MMTQWIKHILSALILNFSICQIASADNYLAVLDKATTVKLADVIQFDVVANESGLWKSNGYILKCDDDTGYECELLLDNKKKLEFSLLREDDVNDFLPYIYQSKIKDYSYKVILIEAEAERGTMWYYAIIFKDSDVIDSFFIEQGRRYFTPTEEYLTLEPEADEMYISPNTFISIFIDNSQEIIVRLDKEYLYSDGISIKKSDKGFLYIKRKFLVN